MMTVACGDHQWCVPTAQLRPIDVHLLKVNNRFSTVLRVLLLPSYVAMTLIGIYWIIP